MLAVAATLAVPHRQRGQILPMMLGLAFIVVIAWLALYEVGQMATARVRLTHTADAVAYSGAIAQARHLNLLAYINRAQVAHQVAMAHLVTLGSEAELQNTQAKQRVRRNPPASLIGGLFGAHLGDAYAQADGSDDPVPDLLLAFQEHDEVVHQVLQQASAEVVKSLEAVRHQAMSSVLSASFPEYRTSHSPSKSDQRHTAWGPLRLSLLADGARAHIKSYRGNEKGPLRDHTENAAAKYEFLQTRDATHHSKHDALTECSTGRHELRRRGQTRLDDEGRWTSQDTLSFHALRSNRWIGCYFREYPMGWGSGGRAPEADSSVTEAAPADFSQEDFWRWVHAHTSWDLVSGQGNPLADEYARAHARHWPSHGLPQYHDLSDSGRRQPMRFSIQLQQTVASALRVGRVRAWFVPGERAAHERSGFDGLLTVTSAAESFYSPPRDASEATDELATLFRPYWRARLVAADTNDAGGRL